MSTRARDAGVTGAGLRGRLLLAFVLLAVPPLVLLSLVANTLLVRGLERAARDRLEAGLAAARGRLEEIRRRAEAQTAAVAEEDLPALSTAGASLALDEIARRRELPILEIVDREGVVIASHHWPAGFGLPDAGRPFPGSAPYRIERIAEGYGFAERLVLVAEREAVWRGAEVRLRGGAILDQRFLAGLAGLMGLEVALRDEPRRLWVAPVGSPLLGWVAPGLGPGRGQASLGGRSLRWVSDPLCPGLFLVVASPAGTLDAVLGDVRRVTLGVAGLALVGALLAALALSARLARPLHELAEGVQRVADGDLLGSVPVRGGDEVAELARSFNTMTQELRASRVRLLQAERVAASREIARRLAHELKKPLFPIQLSIETLRRCFERGEAGRGTGGAFARLFEESSDTILQELRSLNHVVEAFTEFARLPPPRLEPTDLNRVVEQVLFLYEPRAGAVRLEKDLAELPLVAADPGLLTRALGNLVANALEAMPDGGTLRLATRARPDGLAIEVEDTGPGFSEEQRARLFTPYYTTKAGGTGLGLAIVQGIASDHGGRVEVRSEPGQGATFTLVLPGDRQSGQAVRSSRP